MPQRAIDLWVKNYYYYLTLFISITIADVHQRNKELYVYQWHAWSLYHITCSFFIILISLGIRIRDYVTSGSTFHIFQADFFPFLGNMYSIILYMYEGMTIGNRNTCKRLLGAESSTKSYVKFVSIFVVEISQYQNSSVHSLYGLHFLDHFLYSIYQSMQASASSSSSKYKIKLIN